MSEKTTQVPGSPCMDRADFHEAIRSLKASTEERILIERALGNAFLERMSGKQVNLTLVYRSLGGDDPVALSIFEAVNDAFQSLDLSRAIALAKVAANSADKGKLKKSLHKGNPLFTMQNTALKALADLGGSEFKKSLEIDQ